MDNLFFLNLQLFQTEVGIYHQHSEDTSSFVTYFPRQKTQSIKKAHI